MFKNIGRGFRMAGASWTVLKRHPKLALFPVFSGLAFTALIVGIWTMAFGIQGTAVLETRFEASQPMVYAGLFATYFVLTFVAIYFNAALVFCALECFAGRTPSLSAGLGAATARIPQILGWTLVASTVGILLSALQSFLRDKLGILGSLIGGIGEMAWAALTYFVVPVLVMEGVGPIKAVSRSSSILKNTWGESAGGEGGLGLVSFVFMLPVVVVVGVAVALNRGDTPLAGGVVGTAMVLVVAYVMALTIVFSALSTIFRTGVYVYATTGEAPAPMDSAMLKATFR